MPLIDKKWIFRILIILIFLFAFGLRAYNLSEKKGLHVDEHWSFLLSEYKNIGWTEDIPEGDYTAGELRAMIYAPSDPSFSGALGDVFSLWQTNRDSPHTNLYYSALRLSLIGVEGTDCLIDVLIFRAGILNLITFAGCFIAFFLLLKALVPKKSFILLGLLVLSCNPLDMGNVLLFRPYMFQTVFVCLFTAYLLCIAREIKEGVYKDSWQNLVKFAFVLSLMLLSGYYSFIFAFFIGVFFVFTCLRKTKRLNLVPFFFVGCLLAVAFCTVYYQSFFEGFYEYRAVAVFDSILTLPNSIESTYDMFLRFDLGWTFLAIPIFAVLSFFAYKKRESPLFAFVRKYAWIIVAAAISVIFITFISPLKSPRYFVPFLPCVFIIIPLLCEGIRAKRCRIAFFGVVALSSIAMAIMSVPINKVLRTNYRYDSIYESSSNIKMPEFRQDIPVYLTAHYHRENVCVNLSYSIRVFPLLGLGEKQKVFVTDMALNQATIPEMIAAMQKKYDMPKDFVLFYTRWNGGYRNYLCEDKP